MRERLVRWPGPGDLRPDLPLIGDELLRKIERDLYLLWDRWGSERMPDAIRCHPRLWHTIETDMPHRVEPVLYFMHDWTPTGTHHFRIPLFRLRTLFGNLHIIEDHHHPVDVWTFEHFQSWKKMVEEMYVDVAIKRRMNSDERMP